MNLQVPAFESFLPHGESMILLGKITDFRETEVECQAEIGKPLLPGFDSNPVSPLIGLEYIAQTIAAFGACTGFSTKVREEDKIGFIAGVKNFRFEVPAFFLGQSISILAKQEFLSESTAIFNGLIFDSKREKQLLSATVTLVLTKTSNLRRPSIHV